MALIKILVINLAYLYIFLLIIKKDFFKIKKEEKRN